MKMIEGKDEEEDEEFSTLCFQEKFCFLFLRLPGCNRLREFAFCWLRPVADFVAAWLGQRVGCCLGTEPVATTIECYGRGWLRASGTTFVERVATKGDFFSFRGDFQQLYLRHPPSIYLHLKFANPE